jgi:hypothetical protein
VAKPSGDHIPLGGFVLRKMMREKTAQITRALTGRSGFEIICTVCDGLGIVFDCAENAPSSTPIKCRHCGAPRGTLEDLRTLSVSGKQDLFEI